MSWDMELDDQLLQDLYAWIDQIPLSRPKKRIEKDFADGGECPIRYFSVIVDMKFELSCIFSSPFSDGGWINQILFS